MEPTVTERCTFIQLTPHLLIRRGPGQPERESKRPMNPDRTKYLDLDEPTLVTFEPGDQVDLEFLLKIGGIVPYTPPKAKTAKAEGEAKSG